MAAGEREGVGFGHVGDLEAVDDLATRRVSGQTLTELVEIISQFRIVHEADLLLDDPSGFIALLDFSSFTGEDGFGATAHRISRTRCKDLNRAG